MPPPASPATPMPVSTSWQNSWIVEIVAASISQAAARSRSILAPSSASPSTARAGLGARPAPGCGAVSVARKWASGSISSLGETPLRMRSSSPATCWSRSRTRDRSSFVAARVKVTMRRSVISSSPSAMRRVARAAMVQVLPVPALASRTVVPRGSGSVILNSFMVKQRLPHPDRVLTEARGLGVPRLLRRRRHTQEFLVVQLLAPREELVRIPILILPGGGGLPLPGDPRRDLGEAGRGGLAVEFVNLLRPLGGGHRRERQGFAHPPGVDVEKVSEVALRLRWGGGAQAGFLRLLLVPPDDERLPIPIRVLHCEREEVDPRAEPVRGREPGVGDANDPMPVHMAHAAGDPRAADEDGDLLRPGGFSAVGGSGLREFGHPAGEVGKVLTAQRRGRQFPAKQFIR